MGSEVKESVGSIELHEARSEGIEEDLQCYSWVQGSEREVRTVEG